MRQRINEKLIKSLKAPARGNRIVYDDQITGFGVRITVGGAISFVLNYWVNGRERRHTLGRYPELTATAARAEATQVRAEIHQGGDPLAEREKRRTAPTVADLANDYLERHARVHKRPNSVENDVSMLNQSVISKIGHLQVSETRRRDIEDLHQSLKKTPYHANRVLALVSKMMSLAVTWEWRNDNPCRGIPRFSEERRDRWLSTEELDRLSTALEASPNQRAANAIRLLLLTGARRGEVLSARWEDFDLERGVWTKPSHHTKQKRTEYVPISAPTLQLLASIKAKATGEFLFPGDVAGQCLKEIKKAWALLCKEAKLERVRLHDLRHTYASHLVSAGMSLPIVGRLLGHTQPQTTARYAHLADDPLRQATNRFASILHAAHRPKRAPVVPLQREV